MTSSICYFIKFKLHGDCNPQQGQPVETSERPGPPVSAKPSTSCTPAHVQRRHGEQNNSIDSLSTPRVNGCHNNAAMRRNLGSRGGIKRKRQTELNPTKTPAQCVIRLCRRRYEGAISKTSRSTTRSYRTTALFCSGDALLACCLVQALSTYASLLPHHFLMGFYIANYNV